MEPWILVSFGWLAFVICWLVADMVFDDDEEDDCDETA